MPKYIFEIQNLIKVEIEAENKIVARMDVISNLEQYEDEMMQNCLVSDGEKVKD